MVIGAHPDDPDSSAGGLAARCVVDGGEALLVSVTNGNAGHHRMAPDELARRRASEARAAGQVIGADYVVLDHDDGRLTPSVEIREELIRLVREFKPDLLLGPRPADYHPDHRAVGRLMMDASYLLTVPLICPGTAIMRDMPVIAYTYDRFTTPRPFRADAVVAVDEQFESKVRMLACHESQVFEWLPYNGGYLEQVPTGQEARLEWLRGRLAERYGRVADAFRCRLEERYGSPRGGAVQFAEVFEICEYGRRPEPELLEELFPA